MAKKKTSKPSKKRTSKPSKKKEKNDFTTTLKLSIQNVAKANKKPELSAGLTAKFSPEKKLSATILKRNSSRLTNFLHQRMHHDLAMKIEVLSKHISPDLSQKSSVEISNTLGKISRDYGFDFFKN